MKKLINKLVSRKLVYVLLLITEVIVVLFITANKFQDVKLSKDELENIQTTIANIDVEIEEVEYATTVTSRGSDETRTQKESQNTEEDETESKDESGSKNENKTEAESETESATNKTNDTTTTKYVSIEDVKISKDMDLTVRTGLSRNDFIKLIAGVKYDTSGFFEENAGIIYDLCEEYSINEIFFCGLISAESGWNIAANHRSTHNYISLMSNGKLIQYSSVTEGLEVAAQKLHDNYLTSGGKFYHGRTLAGVKTNFCPASSTWVDLVYGRMKQILQ